MRRVLLFLTASAAFLASPPAARAQLLDGLRLGLRVGAVFPVDEDVRDRFGNVLPGLGISQTVAPRPGKFSFAPSLEISGIRSGDDRFLAIPLTLMGEYQFPTKPMVPYIRVDGGIAYLNYRVRIDTATVIRTSRGSPTAAAEAGVIITSYLRASARYRLYGEFDGLTFSNFQLNLVVGALKIF